MYSAIYSLTNEKNKTNLKNHNTNEFYIDLKKLSELKNKNIITEEEFRAKKEKLLKKM